MAIGGVYSSTGNGFSNTYNNSTVNNGGSDNKKTLFERTYYSRLRMSNAETKDISLSILFRSGLMQIALSRYSNGKFEELNSIYLSPTKAYLLSEELKKFKEYLLTTESIDDKVAYGVNGGMGEKVSYIAFHADKNKAVIITIGKFDGNGNIVDSTSIAMNKDYHNALEWADYNDMSTATRIMYDYVELDQLTTICVEFARSMNGAAAYSALDLGRYEIERILNKMDPIYKQLGIETNYNNGYNRGSNNFFNNMGKNSGESNGASISNHTSMDNIMDDFEEFE
jgi:hypothetical protein